MTSPAKPATLKTYLLAWGLGTALITAAAIECLDIPLALFFFDYRDTWWSQFFAHITDFANGGIWYTVAVLGLIAAFVRHKYRDQNPAAFTQEIRAWLFMIVTMASSGTFINAIKLVIGRERPRLLFRDGTFGFHPFTFDLKLADCGFPSGHTQSIWTAMLALGFIAPPLRPLLFTVAVLISASRIIVGAHYAGDVFAGTYVAFFAALLWRQWFEKSGISGPLGRHNRLNNQRAMKSKVEWHTQEHGLLCGFSMHDGSIPSVNITDDVIEIAINATSGQTFKLELSEVSEFNFAGFLRGAIVGHIYVWRVPSAPMNLEISDGPWRTLFFGSLTRSGDIERAAKRLCEQKADHFLVHIDFSYGGPMAFVCKNLSVFAV